jgi:predicted ATPase/class 3 adenylate cyclase/GAF domain-containing protein/tRNA A-37 threonylcarbamoyl transferase component Bud32
MISISGCEITAKLYESAHTAVYRGYRNKDNKPVILKVLNSEYPSPEEIAHFKREYELTRNLNVDGVIETYGLEIYGHSLVMFLEDFGGESLPKILASRKLRLNEFLQLAIRITGTLGNIHQTQIIHKDINPSNIVWNPATDQIKIIDFGISTELSYEHPTIVALGRLEGTLAYMSPEQTGRMNREMDYRTDFYSLGVTFYEILLGFLPFQTIDTIELIHCHLAKTPKSPHALNHNIPKPVSEIVMKLMAKNAEDRYQSARGLQSDLQKCLDQLKFTGHIQFVAIGQDDVSDRFQLPQKLYGRTEQYKTLLDAYDRIHQGHRELILVSGAAGIGKSALVHEIHKPIVEKNGYFVSGKFDQVKQDIPYAPLLQALQALIQQILTGNEAQIALWNEKLLPALGTNGQVVIDIIPEVELIIGKQPPAPKLPPVESQNRLHLILQHFVQVFATPEHPLVLFLDDLQWADTACLKLLHLLMTSMDNQYLLIVGAYRDDEVSPTHPFLVTLNDLEQTGITVQHISLAPLSIADLNQFLADTFRCDQEYTFSLAKLVFEKTYGNPFSVKEFLRSLYKEELLRFNGPSGQWQWNPEQIQGMVLTENAARFMTAKIQKLPENTQHLLQFAACIGNRFDLHTLALAQEKTEAVMAAELDVAIQEGLILPADDTYQYIQYLNAAELKEFASQVIYDFVHNRVREAADALTPQTQRAEFHLKIGRHLLHCDIHKKARAENMTEIVNHLNAGIHLLEATAERIELAKLNLIVGKRAKAVTAYSPSLKYLTTGIALLGKNGWQDQYQLAFELHKERAEVEYLCGNFEQSEKLIGLTLNKAKTDIEKAEIYNLRIRQCNLRAQYKEAIQAGRIALRLLGIHLPEEDLQTALEGEIAEVKELLRAKTIAALIHEPEVTIPEGKIAIQVLDKLILSTFQSNRDLYRVIVAKIVNLSLKYGHASEEAYGYSQYGALLGSVWGYYKAGYEFGLLAVKLGERFNNPAQKCKALCSLAGDLISWVRHVKYTHSVENEAYQAGLYAGEVQFAGFALMHKVMNWFYEGATLEQILAQIPKFLSFSQRTQNHVAVDVLSGCLLVIQNLCGLTSAKDSFDTDSTNEAQYLTSCQMHQSSMALCVYHIMKAQVLYLYEAPDEALRWALQAQQDLDAISSFIAKTEQNFYYSLSLAALIPTASEDDREQYWEQLRNNQKQMKIWADNCPENFLHKYLMIQAEEARLTNNPFAAMQLYNQAIQSAKDHGFIQNEALVHELATRFYLENGFEEFAGLHLKKAHGNYTLWGATRKVKDLEEKYSQLFAAISPGSPLYGPHQATHTSTKMALPTTEKGLSILDLHTVMKASQAISGEIVLAELLKHMMKIVIENAGAQKGWLILEKQGVWGIEAEGSVDSKDVKVLQSRPISSEGTIYESPLPTSIIQYVVRTREPVVLNDAAQEGNFTHDPHITKHHTKSVLCTPLIKQGKLIGILYLENNLATGTFTSNRLEVLNMLSSQMAISIENATLYTHLEEALTHQIELSNNQVELTQAYSRFVPSEFLSLLEKKSITDVQLGDQIEKEITVMFSDIRGFTSLSENMTPQENFNFLNSYLSQVSPVIHKHQGFIDKYIGDSIMALFPTNADDAVQASIDMLKMLVKYNQGRKRAGYWPIRIGIGLNTGDLMLGTVGYQDRMDGTVISDAVNLASRIEGMTKVYGVSLLISETTYFQLEDTSKYAIRIIDQVQAKGKSEPVTVFEVFDGDPPHVVERKLQTLMLFKQGFKLYHQTKFAAASLLFDEVLHISPNEQMEQITEAQALFSEILHVNPYDKVAKIYLQRCTNILKYGVSEEWKGVWAWIEALKKK